MEKSRYQFHENRITNLGYVKFLNQAIEPALNYLSPGSTGLDFGCGPGPVLAELLAGMGFYMYIIDPYFFPDLQAWNESNTVSGSDGNTKSVLNTKSNWNTQSGRGSDSHPEERKAFPRFDFVFSTEVWEHFRNPEADIRSCLNYLKPGGYLIIMTDFWTEETDFKNWYYMKDDTHISFYHEKSMNYIAKYFGLRSMNSGKNRVRIFRYS
jgi:2-polyprenyl-3-methyl-5-hydroxy-6-metoxy-1,4-benzoquinol methylase